MRDRRAAAEAGRWLRYAREDLQSAIALRPTAPRNACLLAQQSAEKAIKSIYAFLDLPIAKSHDLDMLKNSLPEGWGTKARFTDLSILSFWAVESRYPSDLPDASRQDAETAIALAREVLASVESDLEEHGFPG
ncbi:MAG: HEPN domain-containing protein [Armatimonadota bacterium]